MEAERQPHNTHARNRAAEREELLAELDATISALVEGMILFNPAGEIIRMNDVAQEMLRYTPEMWTLPVAKRATLYQVQLPDGKILPPDEFASTRALRGETIRGMVVKIVHPDHIYWVSISAAPVHIPSRTAPGAVVTLTDITHLHELQEQQRVFTHTISHDLRVPLSVINVHAQLLKEHFTADHPDDPLVGSADAIVGGVRRMNVMIQDMVDAARVEGGTLRLHRKPVRLATYLEGVLRRYAAVIDVARIVTDVPADLPPVQADPDRLERIFVNLLTNALNYSPPGSTVLVRARVCKGAVIVAVTDHGKGIPPENLPSLFSRFFQPDITRKAEGVGLGLFIAHMLVEAHGGAIWAESEVGKGSTFYFSLPMV